MSQEDLDIVRRWYRELDNEATFRELTHPDIEWAPWEENHTVHRGLDAARRVVARWSESWSDYGGEIEEVIDAGDEGIILGFHTTASGAASGIAVDVHLYPHIKTREGKLAYLYEYTDRAEALAAVGLEG
jgi:ketosteroid isomerase-like protein